MTEPLSGGSRTAEPELCRVSVIGGNTQLDVGLPATVPIAAFIGDLVALIGSRDTDITESEDGAAPLRAEHWTLARLGREAIAPSRSLTEAEVLDGELLVLRSVGAKESPALFDDVIDAVSRLTADDFRGWSPTAAKWTGLITAVVAVLLALVVLAIERGRSDGLAAPFLAIGAGLAAGGAAAIAARRYADEVAAGWISLCSVLLFFGGGTLSVPGDLGSPHLLLGFSVTLVAATALYRATGTGAVLCSVSVTIALFGGIAALVRMVWEPALPKIAAGVLVVAITLLSAIPRLAAMLARLPVPPVPTAGAAIDPADHEPRPTIEGIGAIGATALPSAAGLGLRARAANLYQTGMIAGVTVAVFAGALGTADLFGHVRWQGITLAVISAIILCLRGRSFADLTQAGAMILGGAAIVAGLLTGLALGDHDRLLIGGALLLAFAVSVLFFGVIGPHIEITPVTRRLGELFEYALIIGLIPLVLWVMGVYGMARNL
ncbi:type VII secretion integral membrane protein EccD [Nocardia bovistercoris]|uniref:Type VII secretion integral membrane protein EccD n=1 Tax=Nocardia bovistercoris TaxID=2785916 RepID=A0A931N3B3_9NOCA|nr:type VII secretion integral membrane protein EccD [Nocardia bovistercoris]MBH0777577.1 type VII secretion integral membrane protein EccD [Nocardia bovistercoris]